MNISPIQDNTLRRPRPYSRSVWPINLAIVAIIALLWPVNYFLDAKLNPYYFQILIVIGINITLAVSLNLINGITGQFSLGHAGFMALGAYTAGTLMKYFHPEGFLLIGAYPLMLIISGLVAAVAGLLVGIPALRLRGDYLAIATLGFGEIINVLINNTESIGPLQIGGSSGLHSIPIHSNFFWTYAVVVVCVVCVWRLAYSPLGKAFLAVREDEIAAAAMGVDTTYYKVIAFVIGAFFAGVAGGVAAMWYGNLDPAGFGFMRSVEIVVMVVLGGSGSITGSVLAATVLTCLPEFLREFANWRMIIYSSMLILMMLLRPKGLLGGWELGQLRRRAPLEPGFSVTLPPGQPPAT